MHAGAVPGGHFLPPLLSVLTRCFKLRTDDGVILLKPTFNVEK
jgi:hypothetical protein